VKKTFKIKNLQVLDNRLRFLDINKFNYVVLNYEQRWIQKF